MDRKSDVVGWAVFFILVLAYIPLFIGGYEHPDEINIYSYGVWLVLSVMFLYSSRSLGFAGWRVPLGFMVGNIAMIILAVIQGGFTANLAAAEATAFLGIIGTLVAWLLYGMTTNKWSPRVIFWGAILSDVLSFYPQAKQYWGPNEMASIATMSGWYMWLSGASLNVFAVEHVHKKIAQASSWREVRMHLEASGFAIEQIIFMILMISVMSW